MLANDAIAIARTHLFARTGSIAMESSARLCLADAIALAEKGDNDAAVARAGRSLAYTVGIGHPDYQRVAGKNTL